MTALNKSSVLQLLFLCFTVLLVQSCGDDNRITAPDYSEVPAPFDTSASEVTDSTTSDGLQIYFIEEGIGTPERVIARDQVEVRYTGRTEDGDVFDSTYRNGSETPRILQNLTTEPIQSQSGQQISPLVDGFRRGLLGMAEGEKRTFVVPPHLGYGSQEESSHELSGETLRFDVELVEIL